MTSNPTHPQADSPAWRYLFIAWLIASISTLSALFLSEVMQVQPCVLCWYQRIFMFPLAVVLPFGLFPLDANVARYALPLAVIGWLVAAFHQLLMAGVIPEQMRPCTQGVPCTEKTIEWFGFVTLPLLSLAAFTLIIALLFVAYFRNSK